MGEFERCRASTHNEVFIRQDGSVTAMAHNTNAAHPQAYVYFWHSHIAKNWIGAVSQWTWGTTVYRKDWGTRLRVSNVQLR